MNESVVESGLNVADTEDVVSILAGLSVGGTVVGNLLLLWLVSLLLVLGLNMRKIMLISIVIFTTANRDSPDGTEHQLTTTINSQKLAGAAVGQHPQALR